MCKRSDFNRLKFFQGKIWLDCFKFLLPFKVSSHLDQTQLISQFPSFPYIPCIKDTVSDVLVTSNSCASTTFDDEIIETKMAILDITPFMIAPMTNMQDLNNTVSLENTLLVLATISK